VQRVGLLSQSKERHPFGNSFDQTRTAKSPAGRLQPQGDVMERPNGGIVDGYVRVVKRKVERLQEVRVFLQVFHFSSQRPAEVAVEGRRLRPVERSLKYRPPPLIVALGFQR
jgi:hypothetical protein